VSLLRNALRTRKEQGKEGSSSDSQAEHRSEPDAEPLTFNGPVLDADDILGIDDTDAVSSAAEQGVPDTTAGISQAIDDGFGILSGAASGMQPNTTEPEIPDTSALAPDSIENVSRHSAAGAELSDTGLEYSIEDVARESSTGHAVFTAEQPGNRQTVRERTAEEYKTAEHETEHQTAEGHQAEQQEADANTANEYSEQELSAEKQPVETGGTINLGGDAAEQKLPPVAAHTDGIEVQTDTDADHRNQAESGRAGSGFTRSGLARSGMNLDPLFFIIIAFACAGLFGSLYALVTQNDAFVSAEYADLRAQLASLDNLVVDQPTAGNTSVTERADNLVGADELSRSDSSPTSESRPSNAVANASLADADESGPVGQEAARNDSDTVAGLPDAATPDNSVVGTAKADNVVTSAATNSAINAATNPAINSATDPAGNAVNAASAPAKDNASVEGGSTVSTMPSVDDSQREIALLQQQLNELKQSLASQDSKISAILSNKTETQAAVDQPASKPNSVATQTRTSSPGTTNTPTMALDKAGEVIVVENRSGAKTDSVAVVASGLDSAASNLSGNSRSVSAGQHVLVDGVGSPGLSVTNSQDIRIQANDTAAPQTNFPQVEFPQVLGRAFHAYSTGDFNQAGALYRRALQLDPYNRDANLGVAAVAVKGGNYAVAVQRYRHLLSLHPDDALAFSSLLSLAGITRDTALENELVVHASQYRHVPALHAALGNHYSQTARWAEASRAYASAVGLAPDTADYLYNLAVSLDNLGDAQAAVETYQRALSLSEVGNYTFSPVDANARMQALQQSR
jgi:tetratricopeptide (TPR) repeat protein